MIGNRKIDLHATEAQHVTRLSECLYVPIAARSINAVNLYVGKIVAQLSPRANSRAVLVEADHPPSPDMNRPIWKLPQVSILHEKLQVWVHVDYSPYRAAYRRAFPEKDLDSIVLDHVLNRRVARLKEFPYLRIVPISRKSNSSHGGLSEKWAVEHHSSARQREFNAASKAQVQYADAADLAKMMDIGGRGQLMDGVNELQELIKPKRYR